MRTADMQETPNRETTSGTSLDWSSRHWAITVLVISLLALGLRLYFVTTAVVDHPIRGDAVQYVMAAWNLLHHHVFSIAPPGSPVVHGDSYRDPGFPVLLALALSIFGETGPWYPTVLVTQALLGASTVTLLMVAARRWMPDVWVASAGLLMAVWPHSVTISDYLLTETLFGFLCALALFFLSTAADKQSNTRIAVSGICFGLASLTNMVLLPFAPLLSVAMLLMRRMSLKTAAILALSGLALPLMWQARNAQLTSTGTGASDRALLNLVQGSWPEYHSSWRTDILNPPAGNHVQQSIAGEYHALQDNLSEGLSMMYHRMALAPFRYLSWYASKPWDLWGWSIQVGIGDIYVYPTLNSPFVFNPPLRALVAICEALNPVLAFLACGGCIFSLRNKPRTPIIAAAISLMALYVTLVYSTLQAEPRYAIPFRGLEILLAGYGLWLIIEWIKARSESQRIKHLPQV